MKKQNPILSQVEQLRLHGQIFDAWNNDAERAKASTAAVKRSSNRVIDVLIHQQIMTGRCNLEAICTAIGISEDQLLASYSKELFTISENRMGLTAESLGL
ncbi:hypothetical protein L4174_023680 (plasmid) [Photobacterium sp. CCB-ST2H9]|uniref:hypothetical protein n=1 Tax=Photobacterium sp. CCB-ST2H9 TaxID=2912855 RepID=UPI0020057ECA|nr:hypothetical protein [Photobacterium sp. CCB-ST2H9]UTM60470.1 hypothetical protein L4174_023680 [Photobacterium sp. CCB-ST2H9]